MTDTPALEDLDAFDIDAMAAEAAAETRRHRVRCDNDMGFRPVSLGDWLNLCTTAWVPFVPAGEIGCVDVEAVLNFDNEAGAGAAGFWRKVRTGMADLGPGWMVRWDNCSLADVKSALSSGDPRWRPEFAELPADDFRGFDMVASFPGSRIRAWARPWLQLDVVGDYPVEYRAFVEDNKIKGISSYYPQRPLELTPQVAHDLDRVQAFANRLIEAQTRPLLCPEIESTHDLSKNHWTADFVRLPDGAVLFLEGGPPHTPRWGAHPCCFKPGAVGGIALKKEG